MQKYILNVFRTRIPVTSISINLFRRFHDDNTILKRRARKNLGRQIRSLVEYHMIPIDRNTGSLRSP